MNFKQRLAKRISTRNAKIGVIGLGYVGLPLAVEFAQNGFFVFGIDIDRKKIKMLRQGISYIQDIKGATIKKLLKKRVFRFSCEYEELSQADILIITVPTPLRKTREPDISYVIDASKKIKENLKKGQLIILESTTYPGTTEEILLPLFSKDGLSIGRDFFLAFSPERIDPGNKVFQTANITKLIGGVTKECSYLAKLIYSKIIDRVIVLSSPRVAEMAKLLENTFRAVNIALVNELALMCDRLKIDIWEVIEAAKTKPFGFMPFYPGPGIGGHCLPIDPLYLSWKSRLHGYEPRLIELASQINSYMPSHVVNKTAELINTKRRRSILNAKILIVGVTYKRDVSDVRESPALGIIRLLWEKQARVNYFDPYVLNLTVDGNLLHSVKLTQKYIASCDCVIIVTDHSNIDYNFILRNAKVVFDTRNVYKNINSTKIFRI